MMQKVIFVVFVACAFCASLFASNQAANTKKGKWYDRVKQQTVAVEYITDELLIKFKNNTPKEEIQKFFEQYKLKNPKALAFGNWYKVKTTADPIEKIQEITASNTMSLEKYGLEPNFICSITTTEIIPNDSLFSWQWNYYDSTDHDIDITEVWSSAPANKKQIIIGIPDSGYPVDTTGGTFTFHPDLPSDTTTVLIMRAHDFSSEQDTNYPYLDKLGHGTFIAGQLIAKPNNGYGIAGLLWGYDYKIIVDVIWNTGGFGSYEGMAEAIVKEVNEGAHIISISGGGVVHSLVLEEAIYYAWGKGVFVVCSAGNSGAWGTRYPARFSQMGILKDGYINVYAVAASDTNDQPAEFSSWDSAITCAAGGVMIGSTTPHYPSALEGFWTRNYTNNGNGTSFSAPQVAGMFGILLSTHPALDFYSMKKIVAISSEKVGDTSYVMNDEGYLVSLKMGHGRINVKRALAVADSLVTHVKDKSTSPQKFFLAQNYPNPFNPKTTIRYQTPFTGKVTLTIYNILGEKVTTLVQEKKNAGSHTVVFNGSKLSSGVYFYKLTIQENQKTISETKKMILIK